MTARRTWALTASFAFALGIAACDDDGADECKAPPGSTGATCESACQNLFARNCRVGSSSAQCAAICAATVMTLDPGVRDRVLACYQAAETCAEVEGCSTHCGPGDGPVVFGSLGEAGLPDVDAGPMSDGGCSDDLLEPNDVFGSATTIAVTSTTNASLCPGNDDFFGVDPAGASSWTVTASFSSGTLNVRLLSPSADPLAESGEGSSPRSVTITPSMSGVYRVRVTSSSGVPVTYSLQSSGP